MLIVGKALSQLIFYSFTRLLLHISFDYRETAFCVTSVVILKGQQALIKEFLHGQWKSSNISDMSFEHAASIHNKCSMNFKPCYPAIYRITLSDNDECRSRSFINNIKLVDRVRMIIKLESTHLVRNVLSVFSLSIVD